VRPRSGLDHLGRLSGREAHRLLDEDVKAGPRRLDRDRCVAARREYEYRVEWLRIISRQSVKTCIDPVLFTTAPRAVD
jgi:hypothetical protein